MPKIKPFFALIPNPDLLSQVVTRPVESYGPGEARLIASEHSCSYLHLINPELDNPYLRGTRQELIYKKIGENLDNFLENGTVVRDTVASFYIYQIKHDGYSQTGIWTLTAIDDYINGHIKKHEHTVERRERLLADYLQQTGLDANPVLVTYPSNETIESITNKYLAWKPKLDFTYLDGSKHIIWAIEDLVDQQEIMVAFDEMSCVYIADGHHRAASMATTGFSRYFTTVYMNTNEVRILEYNRLVRDLGAIESKEFIQKIALSFDVNLSKDALKPTQLHEISMYFGGQWYSLKAKDSIYNASDPVESLDVSILQRNILEPLLGIKDPRTDARISFEGGTTSISYIQSQIDNGMATVAFILFPVSVEQLIRVADNNGVMPPKSTWVEPKFLIGLLTNYFK